MHVQTFTDPIVEAFMIMPHFTIKSDFYKNQFVPHASDFMHESIYELSQQPGLGFLQRAFLSAEPASEQKTVWRYTLQNNHAKTKYNALFPKPKTTAYLCYYVPV